MKKSVFICYSGKDQESVNGFKDILDASIKSAKLSNKISVFDMKNFKDGESLWAENEKYIKKSDIFLVMMSPNFLKSKPCMNNEIPAIMDCVDNGKKHVFIIKLKRTNEPYTNNLFLKGRVFFKSTRASDLDYFEKDMGNQTLSLKHLFVEDLVQEMRQLLTGTMSQNSKMKQSTGKVGQNSKMEPSTGKVGQNCNLIRDIRDLPHLVDFMHGEKRILRVCNGKDKIMFAEYSMRIMVPPMRHLLVVNDRYDLTGIISIRDILNYGVRNKTKLIGNLSIIEQGAKDETVSQHCKFIDEMVYYILDNDNKIDDVIKEFIRSPTIGRPIGAVPVIMRDGDFSCGNFEIVSYIDILENWEKMPVGNDLKNVGVEKFSSQDYIEVVHDDDEIAVAYQALLTGKRSIPVVNRENKYVGIIADTELLGGVDNNNLNEKIGSLVNNRPKPQAKIQIDAKLSFSGIVDFFIKHREYTSLPVLDQYGKIEKMIGYTDVLKKIRDSIIQNEKFGTTIL